MSLMRCDVLQLLVNNAKISLPEFEETLEMIKNQEYLKSHPYKTWENKAGKWCTYFPDTTAKEGRKICRRNTKKELDDAIVKSWK